MARSRDRVEIDDDVWLSQYGEEPPGEACRNRPREDEGETEVSMIYGRVDADQASLLVRKFLAPFRDVRHVRAGTLRRAGFRVTHSPTSKNQLHVSVHPPAEQGTDVEWDDAVASIFAECFALDSVTERS